MFMFFVGSRICVRARGRGVIRIVIRGFVWGWRRG